MNVKWFQPAAKILGKLWYFTNLDFPEIKGIPLLNHHLGAQVVWGRYNLTRKLQGKNCPSLMIQANNFPWYFFQAHEKLKPEGTSQYSLEKGFPSGEHQYEENRTYL